MREPVQPEPTIDPGLRPLAEQELRRRGLGLRFPDPLEGLYRQDMVTSQAVHMRNFTLVTLALYLVVVVLATVLFQYLGDLIHSVVQWVGVTVATLLALPHFCAKASFWRRKTALFLLCAVFCLLPILLVALEPRPPPFQDLVLCAMPISFILLFSRLYFPLSVALAGITTISYAALILCLPAQPMPAFRTYFIGLMILQAFPFLVPLHSVERRNRRSYLSTLIERMNYESAMASNAVLTSLSYTDPLTGVANRRRMEIELARICEQDNARATFLMLDIDWFKEFNDRYGHPEGDRCLQEVAHCLSSSLREGDLLARMGGEEFGVLLPGIVMQEAVMVAERLRAAVAFFPFMVGTQLLRITISIGVAGIVPYDEPERVVAAADKALYRAKQAGRNQVGGPWTKQQPDRLP
jgi:diguanylate cyclase (GGDEF)-like protein